ncbi:hypothetical protein BKE38_16125 [Pseudoroseomonas deserti]|uniref:Uncharacterized protein n=1 Tax=Teichococcus deserti TaxID=1817963 RepID=A0A1V2H0M9_9PROT|nr:hypothetical protein [Pseudoroseomonas deserti]ONG51401.1 hypothetical protein BKE38_16125 [Pseudoroseomonas deserti]
MPRATSLIAATLLAALAAPVASPARAQAAQDCLAAGLVRIDSIQRSQQRQGGNPNVEEVTFGFVNIAGRPITVTAAFAGPRVTNSLVFSRSWQLSNGQRQLVMAGSVQRPTSDNDARAALKLTCL